MATGLSQTPSVVDGGETAYSDVLCRLIIMSDHQVHK